MARLSSEHHPEGPGDQARRKSRGGHKRTRSSMATKRAASPTVVPEPSKRTKRVQIDDHDQLAREMEESVSRSQGPERLDNIDVIPRNTRQRRHSEPLVSDSEDEDVDTAATPPAASQPVRGLTPHLQRLGRPTKATRQARQSMPAQFDTTPEATDNQPTEVQFTPLVAKLGSRTHRRLRRDGLSEEMNAIHEHEKEDSKRSRDLAELRRRLEEKEQEVNSLTFSLETRRMGDIDVSDDHAEQLEAELREARKVIEALQAQQALTPSPSPREVAQELNGDTLIADDDLFMPVDRDSFNVSTSGAESQYQSHTQRTVMTSQITFEASQAKLDYDSLTDISHITPAAVPEKISDQAVKRYELEIEQVKAQSAHLESVVRIAGISLQNLQVAPPGAAHEEILTELRHGFEIARDALEGVYPGLTASLTNGQLIPQLIEAIQGMRVNISKKTKVIDDLRMTETTLRGERDATLGLVSQSEQRNSDLEQQLNDAEAAHDKVARAFVDLETLVASRQQTIADQQNVLDDQEAKINGLEDEMEDKDTQLDRYKQALDKETAELKALTETITRLEEDHAKHIHELEKQHEAEVAKLQERLEANEEALGNAEADVAQKADYIDEQEDRIDSLEATVDEIKSNIDTLRQRLEDEMAARTAVETVRDEHADLIYSHENTIENLEEAIRDLRTELDTVRKNLEAEKAQREQTERDLDDRNQQVEDLTTRIHDAGIQANELRSKLFQVQQEKDAEIAKLKQDATDLEEDLQGQFNTENRLRQGAEDQVTKLEGDVESLQQKLTNTEGDLSAMIKDRDALEAEAEAEKVRLNKVIEDISSKMTALKANAKAVQDSLNATIQDLNNTLAQRDARIQQLEQDAIETAQEHAAEIAERDDSVRDLEGSLNETRKEAAELKEENQSLANRVENEANELLNIMGAHAEESNALHHTIRTQEATIKHLQGVAQQRAEEHATALNDLGEQIKELQVMADTRADLIATLATQKEELIAAFKAQEEDNQKTLDALNTAHRELLARNEELAEASKHRGVEAINRLAAMKTEGLEVKTTGVNLHKVATGKVMKTSEKVKISKKTGRKGSKTTRRQWDSGIGVDDTFEFDNELVDEGVVG
ncbi:hypothetical protein BDV96DRAFT_553484 [Lophiotrema nucula]|uniref:Uncharacterized protein n=1 Tax=Lophiotrema nucula TaxID=690887 RepID=A0A6A5YU08_9PLEO|nr:hypothetical protein BDV96DRAFT_553484 [Lophiotrema nucula]